MNTIKFAVVFAALLVCGLIAESPLASAQNQYLEKPGPGRWAGQLPFDRSAESRHSLRRKLWWVISKPTMPARRG